MCTADYPFTMYEFCCHGALFLWQLQHFINMGCLSNMVAMATLTRFLLKITANLIDKICYYASRMNEPSLNDNKKFNTFKCVSVNLLQNVVRSLLSAGGPCKVLTTNVKTIIVSRDAKFENFLMGVMVRQDYFTHFEQN